MPPPLTLRINRGGPHVQGCGSFHFRAVTNRVRPQDNRGGAGTLRQRVPLSGVRRVCCETHLGGPQRGRLPAVGICRSCDDPDNPHLAPDHDQGQRGSHSGRALAASGCSLRHVGGSIAPCRVISRNRAPTRWRSTPTDSVTRYRVGGCVHGTRPHAQRLSCGTQSGRNRNRQTLVGTLAARTIHGAPAKLDGFVVEQIGLLANASR